MELSSPGMTESDHGRRENERDRDFDEEDVARVRKAMTPPGRQYASQENIPKRIHIIGTGSIGKLVAHALMGIPNPPPITLILHRYQLLQAFEEKAQKAITVVDRSAGGVTIVRDGFDYELLPEVRRQYEVTLDEEEPDIYTVADELNMQPHKVAAIFAEQKKDIAEKSKISQDTEPVAAEAHKSRPRNKAETYISNEPIHNLIVTTKANQTATSLIAVKHRLSKDSSICFLQNGLGVIEEINAKVFPDEATRPTYLQGIVSHGAHQPREKREQNPFYLVHAAHGTISVGVVPQPGFAHQVERPPTPTGAGTDNPGTMDSERVDDLAPSARYITRTLTRTPVLAAVAFTPLELFQLQLEKLAINSVVNPLTSLLDNRNGSILYNFSMTRVMRLLLAETSLIIRSLPELQGLPNVPFRFSAARLETLTVAMASKTRDNISSMLADMRAGKQTEMEYLNGYVVRRGEELGIKALVNYTIMHTVLGKSKMLQREAADEVPVVEEAMSEAQGKL